MKSNIQLSVTLCLHSSDSSRNVEGYVLVLGIKFVWYTR